MTQIMIAGRSEAALEQLQNVIHERSSLTTRLAPIMNGHADPLYGHSDLPSVLILVVLDNSLAELEAYAQRPVASRPPLVVVSNTLDTATMRYAMRASAREFVNIENLDDNFIALLEELQSENWGQDQERCQIVSVINAAGGSGASMLATNLAHISASARQKKTALIDLDLQFAPLSQYLDVEPKNNLVEALQGVEDIDEVAADAYITRHASGLDLLAAIPSGEIVIRDNMDSHLARFLEVLTQKYQRLVLDVPNYLDTFNVAALEQSDVCIIMVQQNLTSLRGATRLMDTLRFDLGITDEHTVIALNRHHKNATLELADVRRSLKVENIFTIPNNFRYVAESINIGVPMLEHAATSPVTKAMQELEAHLSGGAVDAPKNLLTKTLSALRLN